jgi:predicted DNA-binding transcriptional regulator AlpA
MTDILTVEDLATLLKVSTRQVYELTKQRTRSGDIRQNPLPVLRVGGSVRFRKSDIEAWLERISKQ